jgi:hypothetical protein
MPAANRKPLSAHLRDPQSWVSVIAATTLIGLFAGVFEPAGAPAAAAAAADQAELFIEPLHLAAAQTSLR